MKEGRLKNLNRGFQTTFVLPDIGCLRNQVQIADAVVEAVGVVAFFVHLDAQAQVVGGNGLAQGFVVFDLTLDVEFEQVLVEGLHAVRARARHEFADFHELAFENQILHGGGVEQQVDDGGTLAAVFLDGEALADDAGQVERQIHEDLFAAVFLVEVDDTLDGLGGGVGVDGEDAQVAGLGKLEGVFHTGFAANLADTDDVGRLTHRALDGDFPVVGVDADFALGEDAAAGFVDEFDGVFDGDDVAGHFVVAVVEHGCHGGRFTGTCRAGKDQKAARGKGEVFEFGGQAEALHFGDFLVDAAQDHADAALFVVGVDTVTGVAAGLDGVVEFPFAVEGLKLLGVHGGFDDGGCVFAGQGFVRDGGQGAADFDGRREACADEDVGCAAFFCFDAHAVEQGMEVRADFGGGGDVRRLVFLRVGLHHFAE